ncbi:unnamed protein product [Ceratitis capitata]|uniref:(Mediterranean fruit fly) hypothetical protein n=1 Tax=Ceratitis capitata TaxID=7213 RepID=A0A811UB70_CERCA|nr:unnamed protein product [Ceratitis capitata]
MPEKSLANERFLLRENTSEAQQSQFQKNLGIFDEHKFHFESHNTKSAITHQAGARAVNEAEAELHNCDQTQTKEQTSTQQQAVIYNKSAMPQERPNCVQRKTQQDRKIKTLPTDVATLNPTQQRYYKKPRWSLQHCNTKERRTQTKMLTNYRSQAVVPDQANLVQQNAVNLARIQPQRPARPHIATAATFCVNAITSSTSSTSTTSANQLHTKRLRARRLPGLLFISTLLLFLLSALPSVHAACRKEPARTCESICTPGSLNCTLRALLLLPDDNAYTASMCRTMPVLDLADQYIRENSLLPPQVNLEWMTGDVKCDAAYASIKAMDGIVKNCAHVVFGPVCDYALAAVSRIAKYFNSNGTPVISIGGATDSFEDKKTTCADEFYMLVRAGVLSFKSLSLMIIELMKRYNWSNSIAFYERDGQSNIVGEHSCYLMMKSFGDEMRNLNLTFAQYSIVPELRNRTEELVREIGNKHTIMRGCLDNITFY